MKKSSGFTLAEVLLVAALSSVVFIGISAPLIQGVKLFERLKVVDTEQDVAFFLERLTHDLKNSISYSQSPFTLADSKDGVSFLTLLNQGDGGSPVLEAKPAQVAYTFDHNAKNIVRTEQVWLTGHLKKEIIVSNISNVKFVLYPEDAPFPKKVSIHFQYGLPGHTQDIHKDILIQTGSW